MAGEFRDQLKAWRATSRTRTVSQAALAGEIGVKVKTVKDWEGKKPRTPPNKEVCFRIADHLGLEGGAVWAVSARERLERHDSELLIWHDKEVEKALRGATASVAMTSEQAGLAALVSSIERDLPTLKLASALKHLLLNANAGTFIGGARHREAGRVVATGPGWPWRHLQSVISGFANSRPRVRAQIVRTMLGVLDTAMVAGSAALESDEPALPLDTAIATTDEPFAWEE